MIESPPVLSGGLPFLGHALEFYRRPVDFLRRGRERFGPIFSFPLAGRSVTALTGPAANGSFFRASDEQLSAREAYQFTVPIFGRGIAYDVAPQVMDEQLGLVFPALRDERLQAYAGFMEQEARDFFGGWGECGEVDLLAAMNELTVSIASRCLVGEEFRRGLSSEFAPLYRDLECGINLLAFWKPNLPLPSFRRRDRARVRVVALIGGILAARRARGEGGEDFLETLTQARYRDGRALSDEEITGLLLTLIFAGQHTSAVLAAWTGVLLLEHPEFLPPVLAEQWEVFGAANSPDDAGLSLEDLRHLSFLERAIKEAERLRPPLVMLMRSVMQDLFFGNYRIPAGHLALVSPAVSHRLPEVFARPDAYDPERFAPGREEDRKAPFSLIGFGGGKHRCIGMAFAYQQVKVIWSVLLRQFELELVESKHPADYTTFVVGPRTPCRIRYRRLSVRARAAASAAPAVAHVAASPSRRAAS